jgi:hypothetical protein
MRLTSMVNIAQTPFFGGFVVDAGRAIRIPGNGWRDREPVPAEMVIGVFTGGISRGRARTRESVLLKPASVHK